VPTISGTQPDGSASARRILSFEVFAES
jgi:hypothetical protein